MKFKEYVLKNKKWLIPVVAALLVVAIVLSGFAISEAVYRGGKTVEAEIAQNDVYDWAPSDTFDINDPRYPSITPKSGDGNLKILQLTDVHFRNQGTFGSMIGTLYLTDGMMRTQVEKLVKETAPDLIVVTGDLITYQGADHAYAEFIKFIDGVCKKNGCFWTFAFGNHDADYNRNKVALAYMLLESEYCLFELGPTNFAFDSSKAEGFDGEWSGFTGLGNFIIKVYDDAGNLKQALIMTDSNDWVIGDEHPDRLYSTPQAGYYPMQIQWYDWICEGLKQANGGEPLPTSFYAHISPFRAPEGNTDDVLKRLSSDGYTQWLYDGVSYDIQKSLRDNGSTKFVFFGHTHFQGYTYRDETSGIFYTNGNKTGYNYNDSTSKTGGTYAEINLDKPSVIKHYHNLKIYDEIAVE